jgi:MFS family permease
MAMSLSRKQLIDMLVVATSFASGFALMGFEIFGSRVLAPFFGSGTPVWGATISVVMAGMGVGYAFGGKWADKHPSFAAVAFLLIPPALLFAFFPLYGKAVCSLVDGIGLGRRPAALLAATILFSAPVFFLGTVSPMLVKLKVFSMSEVGGGSGVVYAAGTAGGVAGTLVSAFFLIGVLSSTSAIFLLGSLLLMTALPLYIFNNHPL